jgi:hypothetical protein
MSLYSRWPRCLTVDRIEAEASVHAASSPRGSYHGRCCTAAGRSAPPASAGTSFLGASIFHGVDRDGLDPCGHQRKTVCVKRWSVPRAVVCPCIAVMGLVPGSV